MGLTSIEESLVERIQLSQAPILSATVSGTAPIVFSRMRSQQAQRGRSITPRTEDAFTFQAPLIPAAFSELKYENKVKLLPEVQERGRALLFDLSAGPTAGLDTEFNNIRLCISRRTIDDLADEKGP